MIVFPCFFFKNNSRSRYTADLLLEDDGQLPPQREPSDWPAPAIVLGFECLGSTAYSGINSNLVIYFSTVFHETNAASATYAATWFGTCFFTPLLGAVIADTYLGNYWATLVSTVTYLLGMILVTLSASLTSLNPSPCGRNSCPLASTSQNLMFFCGLYLVAFGSGGVKSSLLPLGVDQFDDGNPIDGERKVTFFSSFYLCFRYGNFIASTVLVWIEVNVSWALGYGISSFCLSLALGALLFGTRIFKLHRPRGSPLKSVLQVLVASFTKVGLQVPSNSSVLYEKNENDLDVSGHQILAHTDEFRFLDKAAIVSERDMNNGYSAWRLCTVTQVEELKTLLRLLPILINSIVYSTAYCQVNTTFIEQGNAMNIWVCGFSVPPASLTAFKVICITLWAVIYNKIVVPVARRYTGNRQGLTQLQRIGVGRMLMVMAMAVASLLEGKRLERASVGSSINIAWQLPHYFIIGGSEVFGYIGQLEFFYDQGPFTMKSLCTSLNLLSISLGSYLNSLIISFITLLTTMDGKHGWLPENLNDGHLDYFFWCLAALSLLNFLVFLLCAVKYRYKKVVLEGRDRFHL